MLVVLLAAAAHDDQVTAVRRDCRARAAPGGPDQEPATGVFSDLTFSGENNSAPKYATATVNIFQTGKAGQPIVTHKAFTNFIFGADGI